MLAGLVMDASMKYVKATTLLTTVDSMMFTPCQLTSNLVERGAREDGADV